MVAMEEIAVKLEDFVKETLLEITNGVAAAQEESLLYIAPGRVENEKRVDMQLVKFEVVVTTSKEAGGGIRILAAGDAKASVSTASTNRISFDVPVYFQAPTERNKRHFSKRYDTTEVGE